MAVQHVVEVRLAMPGPVVVLEVVDRPLGDVRMIRIEFPRDYRIRPRRRARMNVVVLQVETVDCSLRVLTLLQLVNEAVVLAISP